MVEIHRRIGRHNHVVAQFCGFRTGFGTAPRHNRRSDINIATEQLVPTDESLAFRVQEFLNALREIALQMVFGGLFALALDAFVFDALLAEVARLPTVARTLVTADVDVFRGEHVDDFAQHVFHELEGLLLTRAQHVGKHAPRVFHLVRTARATVFRISSKSRHHVAGHIDFGDDGDVAVGSVAHDVAALFLSIKTAVANTIVDAGITTDHRSRAPSANRGQFRVFLALETPTLVVGDVPVELVHAVQGDEVDVSLDELDGEEVARAVEVHSAIGEARLVLNHHCRQRNLATRLLHNRKRFSQRLNATEHSRSRLSANRNALCRHRQRVGFLVGFDHHFFLVGNGNRKQNVATSVAFLRKRPHGQLHLRHFRDIIAQETSLFFQSVGIDDGRLFAEHETRSVLLNDAARQRNNVVTGSLGFHRARCHHGHHGHKDENSFHND